MAIMELLAGVLSLATFFVQEYREKKAGKFALAMKSLKDLEKATDDEIKAGIEALERAKSDPDAGRM